MLARLTYRQPEFAVRAALGAGRTRLMAAILGEVMILALLAGGAGLMIAGVTSALLSQLILPGAAWDSPLTDPRVVGFTLASAVLLGLVAGSLPAWQAGRVEAGTLLRVGRGSSGPTRSVVRTGLLMLQAALSVVLLVGAALFIDSFRRVRAVDAGLEIDHLLVASFDLDDQQFPPSRALALQREGIDAVSAIPGVEGVTGSNSSPMETSWAESLRIPGVDSLPDHARGGPYVNIVGDDYFEVMGTPIRTGRGFTSDDRLGAPRVAVVGETMARLIWGSASPLGHCLMIGDDSVPPCTEVIGVVADAPRSSLLDRDVMQYYVPSAQYRPDMPHAALFIRTAGDPGALRERVRATLQGLAPDLSYVRTQSLWQVAAPEIRTWRLGSTLFTIFGCMALLVASIGLYSVVSFDVARRTREIGIRIALGASAREVMLLVFRAGAMPVGLGLLVGLLLSTVIGRWLSPLLFETDPRDPFIYAIVAGVLLCAGALACLVPALRAVRVSPVEALRSD
jgi:predicted permease